MHKNFLKSCNSFRLFSRTLIMLTGALVKERVKNIWYYQLFTVTLFNTGELPQFFLRSAHMGGFQLEFVSISRVINHMTCYKFECSYWFKLQHSDWRANLLKINFPPMRALKFITGHVIYNPAYSYKFQLKTTHMG